MIKIHLHRQAVCTIKQSILLRCLWMQHNKCSLDSWHEINKSHLRRCQRNRSCKRSLEFERFQCLPFLPIFVWRRSAADSCAAPAEASSCPSSFPTWPPPSSLASSSVASAPAPSECFAGRSGPDFPWPSLLPPGFAVRPESRRGGLPGCRLSLRRWWPGLDQAAGVLLWLIQALKIFGWPEKRGET